jgi:ubiquinone/menaquinone biosynthesis C-methylase UbiE
LIFSLGRRWRELSFALSAQQRYQRSPDARFTSVDVSADSVAEAKRTTDAAGLTNVQFQQADIFALPFAPESFDHVFVRFVLERLSRPSGFWPAARVWNIFAFLWKGFFLGL